jgi:hypothetical protein
MPVALINNQVNQSAQLNQASSAKIPRVCFVNKKCTKAPEMC